MTKRFAETDNEITLKDLQKHQTKWHNALFHFIYSNRYTRYQIDLYYYPDTKKFYEFPNVGGNTWLNDNHIKVCSVNNEYSDEWASGEVRETAYYYRSEGVWNILDNFRRNLNREIEYEKKYQL